MVSLLVGRRLKLGFLRLFCKRAARDEDGVTDLLSSLKQCSSSRNLEQGRLLHAEAIESGHDSNVYVATSLIDMYSKCGSVTDARKVFDGMPRRTAVSWNAMMLGYVGNNRSEIALELFASMESARPNSGTFIAAAMACSSLASLEEAGFVDQRLVKSGSLKIGVGIHSRAEESGCCDDLHLGTALVDMYSKCGSMIEARSVFDKMITRNIVTWNALILGYAMNREPEQALVLFSEMVASGICQANSRTFVAALVACASLASAEEATVQGFKTTSLERGMSIHGEAAKSGCCDNVFVGNTLIDMYAKCGSMIDARSAFDRMRNHSVVSWNALLLGYVSNGENDLALDLFSCIGNSGVSVSVSADERTCLAALRACASLADTEDHTEVDRRLVKVKSLRSGMAVHAEAIKVGCAGDVYVASSLVDMYVKCGSMIDARRVFKGIRRHDVVLWTALILGYADNGESELGLALLERMRSTGCSPNSKTFDAALVACGNLLALQAGEDFHAEILRRGFDDENAACLVNFYGRCGEMENCERVFCSSPSCSGETVIWNSLIAGYSQQGATTKALELFNEMREQKLRVTSRTFASVLTSCSRSGLVDQGWRLLDAMQVEFGIAPSLEHFNCMVDMLGRANRLQEAVRVAEAMPVEADAVTWTSVLAASCKWNNLAVGRKAFGMLEDDEKDAAAYLLMANIYLM